MRISREEFLALPLRAHALLGDVRLEDAWAIPLAGGGPGRDVGDLRALMLESRAMAPRTVRLLFWLRGRVGALFGWDEARAEWRADSLVPRLGDDDRSRSLVVPGTPDGSFQLLYRFEWEQLSELRNATIHAFVSLSLRPDPGGYRAYLGVFVEPVHHFSRLYMLAIAPFRRWIVYPAITRQLQRRWATRYASSATHGEVEIRPD